MQQRGIRLQYGFGHATQQGSALENPLFDLLAALREQGSISHVARALGQSYRHVWGSLREWEAIMGQPLVAWSQGRRAQLTPFAQRLLWAETQARARMAPHIEALRSELQQVLEQALDPAWQVLDIYASHDQALPLLQHMAGREHKVHLSLRFAGSLDALKALAAGRCTVAGFHVPDLPDGSPLFARALKPLLRPGLHKLIGSHRRLQGLMMRAEDAERWASLTPRTMEVLQPLRDRSLRFVNRQPGSGTRLLMDHLLQASGLHPSNIQGYDAPPEDTHLAVAARVATGQADVGPGTAAAAAAFNLHFVPMVEERYDLVCLKEALDTPAVQALRRLLQEPAWAEAVQRLPGHAAQSSGEVLSLTRALPWWRFRSARR